MHARRHASSDQQRASVSPTRNPVSAQPATLVAAPVLSLVVPKPKAGRQFPSSALLPFPPVGAAERGRTGPCWWIEHRRSTRRVTAVAPARAHETLLHRPSPSAATRDRRRNVLRARGRLWLHLRSVRRTSPRSSHAVLPVHPTGNKPTAGKLLRPPCTPRPACSGTTHCARIALRRRSLEVICASPN